MSTYYAVMMDGETGGEGRYAFDGAPDLMARTADEIVAIFFEHVERSVLLRHADWELNSVLKNLKFGVVTALGSLIPEGDGAPSPFVLMISNQKKLTPT